jgi:hypothetical protein
VRGAQDAHGVRSELHSVESFVALGPMGTREASRDVAISCTRCGDALRWRLLDSSAPPSDTSQTFRINDVPSSVADAEVLNLVQTAHHGGALDPKNFHPPFQGIARCIMLHWGELNELMS